MKAPQFIYTQDGKEIIETPFDKAIKTFGKEHSLKPTYTNALFKGAVKGKEPKGEDDLKNHKLAVKFLADSAALKQKLNDQIAEEEEKEKEQHNLIVAEASKGYQLAQAYGDNAASALEKLLGKKFHVTNTGLTIAEGAKLSEAEATRAIATLAEVSERNQVVGTTTQYALGDLIVSLRSSAGDEAADRIIEQAVSVTGKSKHTVQEAERMVEWCNKVFKDEPRPDNLTPTHMSELRQGSQTRQGEPLITPAKLRKIIEKVVEGTVTGTGIVDGKEVEQRKPLPCAEVRSLLNEAKGVKPKTQSSNGDGKTHEAEETTEAPAKAAGFLYISDWEAAPFHSDKLDKDALEEVDADGSYKYGLVIDLAKGCSLNRKGKKLHAFAPLPTEETVAPEIPV